MTKQNQSNRSTRSTSCQGVALNTECTKWVPRITAEIPSPDRILPRKQVIYLGSYADENDAIIARLAAEKFLGITSTDRRKKEQVFKKADRVRASMIAQSVKDKLIAKGVLEPM